MHDHRAAAPPLGFFDLPLGAIADAAREGIVVTDARQRIVALNAAAQQMFGPDAARLVGRDLACLVPERLRDAHASHVRGFLASGRGEHRVLRDEPLRALRGDGSEFPVDASISRVDFDGRGGGPYFVAVLRDLSLERGLREELAASLRRMQAVLDLSPAATWIVEDGVLVFINRAALELAGVAQAVDLLGRPLGDWLQARRPDGLRLHIANALRGQAQPPLAAVLRRADGQAREVEVVSSVLPDARPQGPPQRLQMAMTDVTLRERQTREQSREHARQRMALRRLSASVVEAREEERRRIARELHDELGQRLSALKMGLSSLLQAASPETLRQQVGQMLEMSDETVRAVRRIAADLRPLMLDDLGLNAAVATLARDAAQRMGLEVDVDLDAEDPPVTDGTAIALYRMVQEALTNVGRHAQATEVRISLRRRGDGLLLEVRDNGTGFPAQALRREDRYGLLGLRERALMLGGQLGIDNPPGGGARIRVQLPLTAEPGAVPRVAP